MKYPLVQVLLDYITAEYPQFYKGVQEAIMVEPEHFYQIAEQHLSWALLAKGDFAIERSVDAFVQFTTDVNFAQARYEQSGEYENKSFSEVYKTHYSQLPIMDDYLWGVYLTNFLWAHHLEIGQFFSKRFLSKLPANANLIEIAPGHGGWGVWALKQKLDAQLCGYDISSASICIANSIAQAAKVAERAVYREYNALDLKHLPAESCDAIICSFLVEHLEKPQELFSVIKHLLRPNGIAYVTGALSAAQVDHIYEMHNESEMMALAEGQGLRVIESLSTNPKRLLRRAKFIPRSMAIIIQRSG
jgi:ubiquinone/menaquinone biosynthesis C-methylase UbiE